MKTSATLILGLSLLLAGTAMAQTGQTFAYPGTPSPSGLPSPASTLRITETPQAGAAPAAAPMRDTPESLREYERCRSVSDRASVSRAEMEAGVARCLRELEARRQAR